MTQVQRVRAALDKHRDGLPERSIYAAENYLRGPAVYRDAPDGQRPNTVFVPDLPSRPCYDPSEIPGLVDLQRATPEILAEWRALGPSGVEDFDDGAGDEGFTPESLGHLWKVYWLRMFGADVPGAASKAPRTSAALHAVPGYAINGHFSQLLAGAYLEPHCGARNLALTVHLGLEIPADCWIRVGAERRRTWKEGDFLVFDDSFEHEAANEGQGDRCVLLFDVWNPFLHEAERRFWSEVLLLG
jgi:aspartyl/asparaginyl beta-hydroxylase (cupin superfamily)